MFSKITNYNLLAHVRIVEIIYNIGGGGAGVLIVYELLNIQILIFLQNNLALFN